MNTILIVDDNEPFREMLRTVLEVHGFNALVAADGAEGLEIAAGSKVDAIVSDYQMPKADGLSFCQAVRQQNTELGRHVPVWVMTGTAALAEKEAIAAGAEGIFRKPFHPMEITKVIERRCQPRLVA